MDRQPENQAFRLASALVPWAISAVAGCIVLWALLGQSAIAAQMSDALRGVRENTALVSILTRQTADSLAPMANTVVTLKTMNGQLASTTTDLQAMNDSMTRMVEYQRSVLTGLGNLNGHTKEVVRLLGDVGAANDGVLKNTGVLATQTEGEAATLKRLSASAGQSIQYLQTLNRRFVFLNSLPF